MGSVYCVVQCHDDTACLQRQYDEQMANGALEGDLKLFVFVGGLIVITIISVVVAKLVDRCHDRISIRDDVSDISENTRNLLKARMVVNLLSRKTKHSSNDTAAGIARAWRLKTVRGSKDTSQDAENDDTQVGPTKNEQLGDYAHTNLAYMDENTNSRIMPKLTDKKNGKRVKAVKTSLFSVDQIVTKANEAKIDNAKRVKAVKTSVLSVDQIVTKANEAKIDNVVGYIDNIYTTNHNIETDPIYTLTSESAKPRPASVAPITDYDVTDDGPGQALPSDPQYVSVISRPNSRKSLDNSKIVPLFKTVPLDLPHNNNQTHDMGTSSLTAVEVAVVQINEHS